jgi:hypothetical protein
VLVDACSSTLIPGDIIHVRPTASARAGLLCRYLCRSLCRSPRRGPGVTDVHAGGSVWAARSLCRAGAQRRRGAVRLPPADRVGRTQRVDAHGRVGTVAEAAGPDPSGTEPVLRSGAHTVALTAGAGAEDGAAERAARDLAGRRAAALALRRCRPAARRILLAAFCTSHVVRCMLHVAC